MVPNTDIINPGGLVPPFDCLFWITQDTYVSEIVFYRTNEA